MFYLRQLISYHAFFVTFSYVFRMSDFFVTFSNGHLTKFCKLCPCCVIRRAQFYVMNAIVTVHSAEHSVLVTVQLLLNRALLVTPCSCIVVYVHSTAGNPSSTVQVGVGRYRLGVEAHDASRCRHWTRHSLPTAAERCPSGQRSTELLSDLLHRHTAASLLCRHRQLSHCRFNTSHWRCRSEKVGGGGR